MSAYLPLLPNIGDIESVAVLKKLATAHRALAELKGVASSIPNQSILVSTLSLQEAQDSSEIENIITTSDDLYRSDDTQQTFVTVQAKEVHNYAIALRSGFDRLTRTGLLTTNDILEIQACIEENRAGFRKLPGTELKNDLTGETVYTPPQHPDEIADLMANLEQLINDDAFAVWDPLTKMAVIHHRFESIHPFYDGNGRTGRILNILYLVQQGLLTSPVLYLSRYINQHKAEYYRLLQAVRADGAWEDWVLYMLTAVEETSKQTIVLVQDIHALMLAHKHRLRSELPRIYSQDLVNNIFRHPYTKIEFVMDELNVSRLTATRYLSELTRIGLLSKQKIWRGSYYVNDALFDLLQNLHERQDG